MTLEEIRKKYGINTTDKKTTQSEENSTGGKMTLDEIRKKYGLSSGVDQDYINSFVADTEKYSSADMADSYRVWGGLDLGTRAGEIRKWLDKNKTKYTDQNAYKQFSDAIDSYLNIGKEYSSFADENEYSKHLKAVEEYEKKLNFNLEAGQRDIDHIENDLNGIKVTKQRIADLQNENKILELARLKGDRDAASRIEANNKTIANYQAALDEAYGKYGSQEELEGYISQKRAYYTLAERAQNAVKLASVADPNSALYDPEFDKHTGYVSTTKNSKFDIDIGYEYINADETERSNLLQKYRQYLQDEYIDKGFGELKENEKRLYNYYYSKYGKDKAQEYLDSIADTLNYRRGETVYLNSLKDKEFNEYLFGIAAGLDQFESGIEGIFADGYTPTTSTQYASGMVREDLSDEGIPLWYNFKEGKWEDKILGSSSGQIAYDAITTTSNMLPSILASTAINIVAPGAGTAVGSALLGASAGGNAKAEMLNLGYSNEQATAYGIMVGVAEGSMEYFLGHIPGLSKGDGIFSTLAGKALSKVDNALARVAIAIGGSLDEALEEGLQTIIEPWLKEVATNVDWDDPSVDEVLYSSLLGAISSLGLGGGNATINAVLKNQQTINHGQSIIDKGGVDPLRNLSYEVAGMDYAIEDRTKDQNKLAKLARKVDKKASAKNVGRLSVQLESTMLEQTDSDLNISDGMAKLYAARLGKDVTTPTDSPSVEGEIPSVTENPTKKEIATEGKFEASAEGKTIVKETGKEVSIEEIVSNDGGNLMVKLDNGETVNAGDLEFATVGEALVYEMVANMGVNPKTAWGLVKAYDPSSGVKPQTFAIDMPLAYQYGKIGYVKGLERLNLTPKQRYTAYVLGEEDVKANGRTWSDTSRKTPETNKSKAAEDGIIYDGFELNEDTLTDIQKASLAGIRTLAKLSPTLEIHITQSSVDDNGKKYFIVNGKKQLAKNGVFRNGNEIYIDLNAGKGATGTMLYTVSHEVVHFIAENSYEDFKALADFLFEHYGENNVPVDSLIKREIDKLKKGYESEGKALPDEKVLYMKAYEEVVANAMSKMFADPTSYEKLAKLKSENFDLWKKIGEAIKHILNKLKSLLGIYEGRTPDAMAAHYVDDFSFEVYNKLQDLYLKGFVNAEAKYEASIGSRNLKDFAEAKNTEGESLFQYKAMEADEDTYREMLKKWGKMTDSQISNLFLTIDNAMELIKDNLEALDYAWEADIDDRAFFPVKPNSDKLYQVSLDYSTLCRKRILQQTIIAHLQDALNKPLTREEGIAIRDALIALQEEGRQIEVACALCYVESARMKSPEQIKRFIDNREEVIKEFFAGKSGGDIKSKIKKAEDDVREKLHKENPNGIKGKDGETMLDPRTAKLNQLPKKYADEIRSAKKSAKQAYTPTAEEQRIIDVAKDMTVSEFTSPEGLENLAKNYPSLFDAYTSYIRNATKSKGIENDTWWRAGDSMQIGDVLIANMNRENGLRSQSWSDFQVIHILDYIASTIELATRETKEQAYTKVPDYAELMGKTGVMINLSLIPTAKFNGTLDYDSVEGMDYKRALELRDKYHATVGTICIGVDNVQIKMLLGDITIDYVIPYHKSGMSAAIRKLMHIPTWSQYEEYQSEKNLSRADAEDQAKKYGVKLLDASDPNYHKGTSFSEWFDLKEAQQIAKMENANPSDKAKQKKYGVMYGGYMAMQNAANNYLKLCAERGISPKFSHEKADFTAEENYWKLLIDRKMVDNITGEVIEQQTIKPIFDEKEVMRILNDELERYPKVKEDQEYAIRKVTEGMLSGKIKGGMSAKDIAKVMQTPVDNVTNVNIFASTEGDELYSVDDDIGSVSVHEIEAMLYGGKKDIYGYKITQLYKGVPNKNPPFFSIYDPDGKEITRYGGMNSNIVSTLAQYIADDMTKKGITPAKESATIPTKESPVTSDPDSVSNRSLLANALESVAKDATEKKYLGQYKDTLYLVEGAQKKLAELRADIAEIKFSKSLKEQSTGQPMSVKEFQQKAYEIAAEKGVDKKNVKFKLDTDTKEYFAYVGDIKSGTLLVADKTAQDKSKLALMERTAANVASNITKYDETLLRLEALKPIKDIIHRERQVARQKAEQEGREMLAAYREKAAKTQRELMTHYQESRKKSVENRHKTEMRHKIKNVAHELDALLNRGTKERNVKKGQSELVRRVLDLSDMLFATDDELIVGGIVTDLSDREKLAVAEFKALYDEYHSYDESVTENKEKRKELRTQMNEKKKALTEALERERKRISKAKASDIFNALEKEYEALKNSEYSYIRNAFENDTLEHIKKLGEDVGTTLVKDMTLDQMESVYKAFKMVKTMVSNSNKFFNEEIKESAEKAGQKALSEVRSHGHKEGFTKAGKAVSEFAWNNLKPIYLMERIGSKTLQDLFQNILNAESEWAKFTAESQAFIEDQKKKFGYDKWDLKKKWTFKTETGLEYELNLEQMFSIYAYAKRGDQALGHLQNDGFVFDKVTVKKKGVEIELNDKTAYKVTNAALEQIFGKEGILTEDQKAFVDAMQKYLSDDLAKRGNAVSNKLYGIDLFGEEYYLGIRSEGAYLERAREQNKGTAKMKNRGFTKSTQKNARNAIVLSEFTDLWSGHVIEMNEYAAFTLPLEDFYRVYNYQNDSSDTANKTGVIPAIDNAYGEAATKAIDRLLDDINGGAKTDYVEGAGKKLIGLFKKAKVMLSLSVIVQQPSAIVRAMSIINPKYFVGQKTVKTEPKLWEEIKKYAPVAIIKEMGYFDTGMGYIAKEWVRGNKTFKDRVDDIISWAPAKADEITWRAIWKAVKRETLHNNPKMNPTSEEFLALCGKRFEEIIRLTQVYDSTLSRSANMRNKSVFMQMATSFMAEPTTSINMLEMAVRSGDIKRIGATVAAVYGSYLLNAILVALPYAARDDDEDETFTEKYFSALTESFLSNAIPLTSLPFVKDLWSIAQGYDVERLDMSLWADFADSLVSLAAWGMKDDKDTGALIDIIVDVVGGFANLTGIPFKNLVREAKGIINFAQTLTKDFTTERNTTWKSLGDALEQSLKDSTPIVGRLMQESKADKLFDAIMARDKNYTERLKDSYSSEGAYESAIRKTIGEKYKSGEISRTKATSMLTRYGDYDENEAYWKLKEWDYKKRYGDDAEWSKYSEFYTAVKTGKNLKTVIKDYTDHGVSKESLASQITSYYKPLYKKMSKAQRANIKGYLLNAYQLLGYKRADKARDIDNWLKDK